MNQKSLLTLLITLWIFIIHPAFAGSESELNSEINRILASAPTDLNAGIIIENPADGKILYEKNPNRLFIPASNMKIITAYAALTVLGTDYAYKTAIYADTAKVSDGVLHGNVYLQFSGDPTLTSKELSTLFSALTQAGIRRIAGQFVIVDRNFDQIGYGPGWMWDDGSYCDGVPVHGIIVNHNCFVTNFYSGAHVGAPTTTRVIDGAAPFTINNQVVTANSEQHCRLMISSNDLDTFTISGCINQNKIPQQFNFAINSVNGYAIRLVQQNLRDNHITLDGSIQFGNLAGLETPLFAVDSKPLPEILGSMLKPSDNLYANALFKKVGQKIFGEGTWDTGKAAVKDVLESRLHINPRSLVIVDGSGTSRYNLVTPAQLLAMLNSIYKDPAFYQIFLSAMPSSGYKGTLEYRMNQNGMLGHVIAKTGSLKGISSLSGYLKTSHKQTLIFVMLMNNFVGHEYPYRNIQDKICDYLYRQY